MISTYYSSHIFQPIELIKKFKSFFLKDTLPTATYEDKMLSKPFFVRITARHPDIVPSARSTKHG